MPQFDPGYHLEPFRTLCEAYPDEAVYPRDHFRIEWGPIFHRGRLDGTARILVLGQDPAQNENIVRRILVGEAGRRLQGYLAKLGFDRSYVLINTFVYSVYGNVPSAVRKNPDLVRYRNSWIDALMAGGSVEAVVALGELAEEAWGFWRATPAGQLSGLPFARITHPTQPESSSKGDKAKLAAATRTMLAGWNQSIVTLRQVIQHPDVTSPAAPYGEAFAPADKAAIPDCDLPAGLPAWMREQDGWARRVGKTDAAKRANITIKVPRAYLECQRTRP